MGGANIALATFVEENQGNANSEQKTKNVRASSANIQKLLTQTSVLDKLFIKNNFPVSPTKSNHRS